MPADDLDNQNDSTGEIEELDIENNDSDDAEVTEGEVTTGNQNSGSVNIKSLEASEGVEARKTAPDVVDIGVDIPKDTETGEETTAEEEITDQNNLIVSEREDKEKIDDSKAENINDQADDENESDGEEQNEGGDEASDEADNKEEEKEKAGEESSEKKEEEGNGENKKNGDTENDGEEAGASEGGEAGAGEKIDDEAGNVPDKINEGEEEGEEADEETEKKPENEDENKETKESESEKNGEKEDNKKKSNSEAKTGTDNQSDDQNAKDQNGEVGPTTNQEDNAPRTLDQDDQGNVAAKMAEKNGENRQLTKDDADSRQPDNAKKNKTDLENNQTIINPQEQGNAAVDMIKRIYAAKLNLRDFTHKIAEAMGSELKKGIEENKFSFFLFSMFLAIIKDILDMGDILIISALFTACFKITLTGTLFFVTPMGHLWKRFKNIFWKILILWCWDFIPIIGFLPVTTLSLLLLKHDLDKERKKLEDEYLELTKRDLNRQEKKELKHININKLREEVEGE